MQCIKGIAANTNLKEFDGKDDFIEVFIEAFIEAVFGCEGAIGYQNIKRNKSGYKAAIRALSLGMLLLLVTGGLSNQAEELRSWMEPQKKWM